MGKRQDYLLIAIISAVVLGAVVYILYTRKWCSSGSSESYEYQEFQPMYGNPPCPGTFPNSVDVEKLRVLAGKTPAGKLLFNILMGNGNNCDPSLPQYGLLFCAYTPKMFSGANDARHVLSTLSLKSAKAKQVMSILLNTMNNLVRFYKMNGISDPCNRMNLFVQHVQPIKNFVQSISSNLANLIKLSVTGEVSLSD